MKRWSWIAGWVLLLALRADPPLAWEPADIVLVMGAPGAPEYEQDFVRQTEKWMAVAEAGGHRCVRIGCDAGAEATDYDGLRQALASVPAAGSTPLWLVLIGHGTFDGKDARFNLRGPDLTPAELAEWLKRFQRPVIVINTASASAPFLPTLAGSERTIVTATRSGFEHNATRFGRFLAEAWFNGDSDLDRDGQVSLLEACVMAWRGVAEFYESEGRLVTEHALLEDNGDGLGTPLDWFRGVRAMKEPREGSVADGFRARQFVLVPSAAERGMPAEVRARRDALERSIEALRQEKATLAEEEYYGRLERLLLDMARTLLGSDSAAAESGGGEDDVAP
jgi:hypothetical protein